MTGILSAIVIGYVALVALLAGVGLLMTHVLLHGTIGHWDNHVNEWFVAHRTPRWNDISASFTQLANTMGIVVVAAVVSVLLLLRKWGARAALLLIGLGLELSVFLTTNYTVRRPRPSVKHLGSTPSTFSWPSGHIAATFVLYGGIALLITMAFRHWAPRAAAWLVAAALTVSVGLSRVYRGEHHPTDVFAGLALGIGALWAAAYVVRIWQASTREGDAT